MRINKFIARATGISRRAADELISKERVRINKQLAQAGQAVGELDQVTIDGRLVTVAASITTIMLNKPVGYVCSRDGQGSKTIYHLLPEELHHLKPVGRLDKDSSGLILLTDDGNLAQKLTHPSFEKIKRYEVRLNKSLTETDRKKIAEEGILLDDGLSKLLLRPIDQQHKAWGITMHEGRNRQIRRTFEAIGYKVIHLHRTQFGDYMLNNLRVGAYVKTTVGS